MPQQNRPPSKILSLLESRERYGVVPPSARGARGPAQVDRRISRDCDVRVEDLSTAIAWYVIMSHSRFVYHIACSIPSFDTVIPAGTSSSRMENSSSCPILLKCSIAQEFNEDAEHDIMRRSWDSGIGIDETDQPLIFFILFTFL